MQVLDQSAGPPEPHPVTCGHPLGLRSWGSRTVHMQAWDAPTLAPQLPEAAPSHSSLLPSLASGLCQEAALSGQRALEMVCGETSVARWCPWPPCAGRLPCVTALERAGQTALSLVGLPAPSPPLLGGWWPRGRQVECSSREGLLPWDLLRQRWAPSQGGTTPAATHAQPSPA